MYKEAEILFVLFMQTVLCNLIGIGLDNIQKKVCLLFFSEVTNKSTLESDIRHFLYLREYSINIST